jgi:hypothetical protein
VFNLISIGGKKIKNTRSSKYLGYTIRDSENMSSSVHTKIDAAFQKWNEFKKKTVLNEFS